MQDDCGVLGGAYVGLTLALPPDALSTLSLDVPVRGIYKDFCDDLGKTLGKRYTRPLNLHDLAWVVAGPIDGQAQGTIGPPSLSLLLLPS